MDTEFDQFVAVYLAGFFTFVAVFYFVLTKIQRARQQWREVIYNGERFSRHWWNHAVFNGFRYTIWSVCVARIFWPEIDQFLFIFKMFHQQWIQLSGVLLMTAGFTVAMASSLQLDKIWRSGIDPSGPSKILTHGLYGLSRNPNFLGVKVAQIGFFFALPSMFTLGCLIAGWISIDVQVQLEERHLRGKFGNRYDDYAKRVGRWIRLGNPFSPSTTTHKSA